MKVETDLDSNLPQGRSTHQKATPMQSRNSESIVTFRNAFSIGVTLSGQAAGSYRVAKEEELIEGLYFPTYHVTSTSIEIPAIGVPSLTRQYVPILAAELADALELDNKAAGDSSAPSNVDHTSMRDRAGNFAPLRKQ
jgi:hypothetical protein